MESMNIDRTSKHL